MFALFNPPPVARFRGPEKFFVGTLSPYLKN